MGTLWSKPSTFTAIGAGSLCSYLFWCLFGHSRMRFISRCAVVALPFVATSACFFAFMTSHDMKFALPVSVGDRSVRTLKVTSKNARIRLRLRCPVVHVVLDNVTISGTSEVYYNAQPRSFVADIIDAILRKIGLHISCKSLAMRLPELRGRCSSLTVDYFILDARLNCEESVFDIGRDTVISLDELAQLHVIFAANETKYSVPKLQGTIMNGPTNAIRFAAAEFDMMKDQTCTRLSASAVQLEGNNNGKRVQAIVKLPQVLWSVDAIELCYALISASYQDSLQAVVASVHVTLQHDNVGIVWTTEGSGSTVVITELTGDLSVKTYCNADVSSFRLQGVVFRWDQERYSCSCRELLFRLHVEQLLQLENVAVSSIQAHGTWKQQAVVECSQICCMAQSDQLSGTMSLTAQGVSGACDFQQQSVPVTFRCEHVNVNGTFNSIITMLNLEWPVITLSKFSQQAQWTLLECSGRPRDDVHSDCVLRCRVQRGELLRSFTPDEMFVVDISSGSLAIVPRAAITSEVSTSGEIVTIRNVRMEADSNIVTASAYDLDHSSHPISEDSGTVVIPAGHLESDDHMTGLSIVETDLQSSGILVSIAHVDVAGNKVCLSITDPSQDDQPDFVPDQATPPPPYQASSPLHGSGTGISVALSASSPVVLRNVSQLKPFVDRSASDPAFCEDVTRESPCSVREKNIRCTVQELDIELTPTRVGLLFAWSRVLYVQCPETTQPSDEGSAADGILPANFAVKDATFSVEHFNVHVRTTSEETDCIIPQPSAFAIPGARITTIDDIACTELLVRHVVVKISSQQLCSLLISSIALTNALTPASCDYMRTMGPLQMQRNEANVLETQLQLRRRNFVVYRVVADWMVIPVIDVLRRWGGNVHHRPTGGSGPYLADMEVCTSWD
eukprot:TRINITY_DN9229_c0_g1_i1.p1 TRINITY_DN9229_c0_g1~~TRINITY_DN9229_c0_g1_i1.p1  ORF type:complete len:915 (+),score=144.01 TRINITY_DN9229_c0_g1_i1:31-2745(+)